MTIRNKLILGFACLLILMAAVAGIGITALRSLQRDAHQATTVGDRLNSIALEIQVHNLEAQRRVKSYLAEVGKPGPQKARALYLEEADFEIHEMETLAARALAMSPTSEQRATFGKLSQSIPAYKAALAQAIAAAEKHDSAEEQYQAAADKLHDDAEDGEVTGRDASQTSEQDIERTSRGAMTLSIGVSLIGLLAGIVMSTVILRAILRPVNHLKDVAENVSMGNLKIQVNRFSTDEIGDLSDSFGRMLTAVRFFRMEAEEAARSTGDSL